MPVHNLGVHNNAKHILENLSNWPKSNKGNRTVQIYPSEGSRKTFITHNFADKCTWYQKAIQVSNEELIDSGDHKTYNCAYAHIIDLKHGRVTYEDKIVDVSNYYVILVVDDVEKIEDIDYSINYVNGSITFSSALSGTETVLMSYYYGGNSEFKVTPTSGKLIRGVLSEAQFSKNVSINDTAIFGIYVNDVLYTCDIYKNAKDYINSANSSIVEIPAFGELTQNVLVFPWKYLVSIDIKSSLNMDLRVKLEQDIPFIAELAVLVFYCIVEDE